MWDAFRDLRFACRRLSRSPSFTAVSVLMLALGIGGTTALFSLVDAVLIRALPYNEPHRLVEIWGQDAQRNGMRVPERFLDALRKRSTTLQTIAIHGPEGGALRTPDGPVRVSGRRVSANYLDMMGVPLLAGRAFLPEDDMPGAPAVMVVSYGFWQRRLGGDPEAVGRTVYMVDIPYTIVGIMPPEFQTSFGQRFEEFWTPHVRPGVREVEREMGYELVARLSPGVTHQEARRELRAIAASVDVRGLDEWHEGNRTLGMVPLKEDIIGDSAYALQLLLAAAAIVLAIVCGNLAQLLLARSDGRIGEFATRKAIGAPSSQLFRLALTESLLLSAAGGLAGVGVAKLLLPAMLALAPSEIPRLSDAVVDDRVLIVAVALVVVTGCACGLVPAFRLSRLAVIQAMKRTPGSASSQGARFRSALVVGQVASSVALLALAGLVGRTFITLLPSNLGFQAESRAVRSLGLLEEPLEKPVDRLRRWDELVRRVEALPGVSAAGVGSNIPFGHDDGFRVVRRTDDIELSADVRTVSPNYFQLLGMPLVRGRIFTSADGPESPGVAIVNERLARKLVPGGDVLGRTVHIERGGAVLPAYQIVGVLADVRSTGTTTDIWDEIYVPLRQSRAQYGYLIVQSELDSGTLDKALRREIRAVLPHVSDDPMAMATPVKDLISRSVAGPRFSATLVSAFSAMALLLAAIGLFGLIAYSVSQRHYELGIRAALGARPWDLVVTITRSAVMLTFGGVALGLTAGAYLTRFVESQLYAVEPLDGPTFIGAAVLMLAVAGVAACLPARRAARTDPMSVLRYE